MIQLGLAVATNSIYKVKQIAIDSVLPIWRGRWEATTRFRPEH